MTSKEHIMYQKSMLKYYSIQNGSYSQTLKLQLNADYSTTETMQSTFS